MLRSLGAMFARKPGRLDQSNPETLSATADVPAQLLASGQLNIPIAQMQPEDVVGHKLIERGRHLARQDLWDELSQEMHAADAARKVTPCGQPVVDLLAFGARSDVVLAVEHALSDGKAIQEYDLLCGISELENEYRLHSGDPMIGLVVALTHIDMAWAWRGTATDATLPPLHSARCAAHFDRAAAVLPLCQSRLADSPALAAAECALLASQPQAQARVAQKYEALIALDPQNQRHMRAMGTHLLPRWFGSHQELEVQALRIAAQTHSVWGAGGYTWVQFDAIALDDDALAQVDVEYFLEGLCDIVHRRPDQQMINLLAAYCAITLQKRAGTNPKADEAREQICEAAQWLIRDHMTELHPMIWAHAADGFNNSLRINSPERFAARGHTDALRAISDLFREELRSGQSVTFTPSGLQFSGN